VGNVIPAERDYFGGKATAAINQDSEFVPGVERDGDSASGITENGEAVTISSGTAGASGLGWAYYRLTMGGEQPGVVSCDVNLLPGDSGMPSEYYVGLADFGRGAWEWRGPFADSNVRLSTGADVAAGTDYLSPLGNLFVCVVAHDGSKVDVVGVAANAYDAGDTTAPPTPAGLTLTPVSGGLELTWNGVVAGDLAGYSIYYDTKWFYSGAYPGVQSVGLLEGTTRHVLTGLSDAKHVRVRVGAVDVSGNEGAPSELVFALPLAGAAPTLTLTTSEPSGMLNDAITLSATGAEFYDWDVDGDGIYDITGNPGGSASVDTSHTGIIRPSVRGTSGGGTMVACGGVSVIVASNSRPVANGHADPASGPATLTTTLTGEGEDFDGTIVQYAWDLDDDGVYDWLNMVTGNVGPRNYPNPGLYNVKFRVADDQGAWDVDTVAVLVYDPLPGPNDAPVAVLGANKTTSYWPFTINFDGSGSSDSDGSIVLYEWDFDGDGSYEEYGQVNATAYTFPVYGVYESLLRVTDDDGAQHTDTLYITLPSEWWMSGMEQTHNRRSPYVGAQTNNVKWSYPTGGEVWSSPAIGADGTVYVGSNDGKLYAINPDGGLKWSYTTGFWMRCSTAIGADGTVYVGSQDCDLYAINPDGSLKWSYPTGGEVYPSPAIGADGTVYVGSQDCNLYAINPDGSLKWSYATWGFIASSPAIGADGTVYVGSMDDNVYAINPDGSLKWSYTTGGYVVSSPAIGADGTVYVGSGDYNIYAINPDGSFKWSYTTGGDVYSSPAIGADGTVYVGSEDWKLYAINQDGSLKWSYTTGSDIAYSSPAIGADGTVYVGSMDDNVYAINPDGSLKWSYATGGEVWSSPAIGADGTVYVGSYDGKLYAFGP
jgi:outer membrane protein assembly factor BamB